MTVYFEGGGDSAEPRSRCREGLHKFLYAAGFQGKMPRIVACGSRQNAYKKFCTAIQAGEKALLLVDSEDNVDSIYQSGDNPEDWKPWQHLKARHGDNWEQPDAAENMDCHLIVQCMETWFLADREELRRFFGQGFNANALPSEGNPIESLEKNRIYSALAAATRDCSKKYAKGKRSFELLARIEPERVMAASPWAKRFVDAVREKMGALPPAQHQENTHERR